MSRPLLVVPLLVLGLASPASADPIDDLTAWKPWSGERAVVCVGQPVENPIMVIHTDPEIWVGLGRCQ